MASLSPAPNIATHVPRQRNVALALAPFQMLCEPTSDMADTTLMLQACQMHLLLFKHQPESVSSIAQHTSHSRHRESTILAHKTPPKLRLLGQKLTSNLPGRDKRALGIIPTKTSTSLRNTPARTTHTISRTHHHLSSLLIWAKWAPPPGPSPLASSPASAD
ncbi:hypothetical protein EJ03DRAFT_121765 [Teratosphaeria nubilosa]|uniref:Uncharacterized protein n=1 Tax=Teratosphaeria nubilosa TaxID=161662 RepID=A0A6G1L6Y4_9PEZI|nr:hypothetical protein EJ03DRAFT_121765 [Teratosphaeria nubilosa]